MVNLATILRDLMCPLWAFASLTASCFLALNLHLILYSELSLISLPYYKTLLWFSPWIKSVLLSLTNVMNNFYLAVGPSLNTNIGREREAEDMDHTHDGRLLSPEAGCQPGWGLAWAIALVGRWSQGTLDSEEMGILAKPCPH